MAKTITFNDRGNNHATEKILNGVNILADAVKITLGPSGRVVMFEREYGDPIITKDGVTVAREIELEDETENMAAAMVRQAASKTASLAGDGTTTATIYTQAILKSGVKHIAKGVNPQEVKKGINHAVEIVVKKLAEMAKPIIDIDQIKQVAVCSANQDQEIGGMIAEAMERVGTEGVITIEEGQSLTTSVSVIDGLQFPRGYLTPQFATNKETQECEYEDAFILLTDQRLSDIKTVLTILELAVKTLKNQPLVVVADDFSDDCLGAMILNKLKGSINIVAVKAPDFGDRRRDTLEDIAIATGGTVLTRDGISLSDVQLSHLGKCKKIKVDRDTTTIFEGAGEEETINERIALIRAQIDKIAGDFDRERLQERLAKLTGGIAQISAGGATEAEVREKKDRIDDALHACKAAIEEGILPGGGVSPIQAGKELTTDYLYRPDFQRGIDIVKEALEFPLRQLAINTGADEGVVINKIIESNDLNLGFDVFNKQYVNMVEAGIVVPAKVERVALQNAASIASLLLTTDCTISIIKNQDIQHQPQFPSLA